MGFVKTIRYSCFNLSTKISNDNNNKKEIFVHNDMKKMFKNYSKQLNQHNLTLADFVDLTYAASCQIFHLFSIPVAVNSFEVQLYFLNRLFTIQIIPLFNIATAKS